jgi:hypothetical protein
MIYSDQNARCDDEMVRTAEKSAVCQSSNFSKKNINKSVIYFTILTDRSLARIFYIKEASAPENCADKMCF